MLNYYVILAIALFMWLAINSGMFGGKENFNSISWLVNDDAKYPSLIDPVDPFYEYDLQRIKSKFCECPQCAHNPFRGYKAPHDESYRFYGTTKTTDPYHFQSDHQALEHFEDHLDGHDNKNHHHHEHCD